ncbi:MAG: MBOAT family protein [Bacteroidetes bacterium]|nr:MBOAT family protein [Bacteroidota bacterium]
MLFNSLLFLVFFVIVFITYWALPHRFRWMLLLVASLFFYGVFIPSYTLVLIFAVLFNYYFGKWIDKSEEDRKRKQLLVWGIIINIGLLAGFKYFNPVSAFIYQHFHLAPPPDSTFFKIVVPLGISFFTFSNISYLIEIKRRKVVAENHLGYFASYVTFFPKLIQGPIERPQHFMPQVIEKKVFSYDMATAGLRLMLWGFFKKLVIADRLAMAVNPVYDNPHNYTGLAIVMATIFYSIQIYADFSGYIDIARGAGKLLGFDLSKNFNLPYAAKSIKDFWTRWHITLSSWLRDYIFLPVAFAVSRNLKKDRYLGMKTDNIIYSLAISVTFVLCGIWHGVGWTFLTWGAMYAVYLIIGHLTEKAKRRFYKKRGIINYKILFSSFQILVTFTLVTFAWLFFRANSMNDAINLFTNIFTGWGQLASVQAVLGTFINPVFSKWEFLIIIFCVPLMFLTEYLISTRKYKEMFFRIPLVLRWGFYYFIILFIFTFGKFDNQAFVYFQF